jgi:hypothetical protein
VIFEPQDLLAKLAALVPAPRVHLVRFHGILGPAAAWRSLITTEMASDVNPYNVSRDGRFLMRVPGENEASPITILLNWSPNKK